MYIKQTKKKKKSWRRSPPPSCIHSPGASLNLAITNHHVASSKQKKTKNKKTKKSERKKERKGKRMPTVQGTGSFEMFLIHFSSSCHREEIKCSFFSAGCYRHSSTKREKDVNLVKSVDCK